MTGKLQGKAAIVTGSGAGIGRATASLFAAEGAAVTVVSLSDSGKRTVAEIEAAGGKALFVRCDIGESDQVQAMVRQTVDRFGRLDVLVNNAARNRPDPPVVETVVDMPEEHWYATLQTNLSGYFLCCKYALPHILATGGGAIVNVSSAGGVHGVEKLSAYAASKAGVISLTKCMALDYGPLGVRVNAILPTIDTDRWRRAMTMLRPGEAAQRALEATIPLQRMGSPEEAARVILFLASDDSSYTSGAVVPIDGGAAARR
jgi:NAD(P)-dependent dehydrogenase (short-subunit alcohol dehydrogenase family)